MRNSFFICEIFILLNKKYNFQKGIYDSRDFDIVWQTIKPFVFTQIDKNDFDYVAIREKLVFDKYGVNFLKEPVQRTNKTIGINNSLLVNSLFHLYYNFFNS